MTTDNKPSMLKEAVRRVAITGVAAACMAPSIHINVLHQLAHGGDAALSKSAVSAMAVIVAGICPIKIKKAIAAREWVMAAVCASVFAACLQFNLVSAIGVSSTFRAESVGAVVKDTEAAVSLQRVLDGLLADVAPLKVRAGGSTGKMIEGERAAMRNDYRWDSTEGCKEGKVTRPESKSFCTAYEAKGVALAAADKVAELDKQIADLRPKVEAANANPNAKHGQPADPQTATVVSVLKSIGVEASMDKVTPVLNLELALILEVISALGPLVLSYVPGLTKGLSRDSGQAVHESVDKDGQLVHLVHGQAVHSGQAPVHDLSQPIDSYVHGQDGQRGQDGQTVHFPVHGERPKLSTVPKDEFADKVFVHLKNGQTIREIADLLGVSKSKVGNVAKQFADLKPDQPKVVKPAKS